MKRIEHQASGVFLGSVCGVSVVIPEGHRESFHSRFHPQTKILIPMLIIVIEMDGELEHSSDLQSRYYRKDDDTKLLETHRAASWNDSSRRAELSIHGPLIRLMIGFIIVLFLQKTLG
jgi:hypothetical protein